MNSNTTKGTKPRPKKGQQLEPPQPLVRESQPSKISRVHLFHLFGGTVFIVGIVAHFYLVLVVSIVQGFLSTTTTANDPLLENVIDGWNLSIYVLISALLLVAVSFFTKWSWPIVSEKALLTALLWMLYAVIIGNFGICVCCDGGLWSSVCGGVGYEQLFSLLWILALVSAFFVDAWNTEMRRISLISTMVLAILMFLAPLNGCSTLPAPSLVLFIRITLFHIIWHSNRLQRVAESTLYNIYMRKVRELDAVRVQNVEDMLPLELMQPIDIVSAWKVMSELALNINEEVSLSHQLLFAHESRHRSVFSGAAGAEVDQDVLTPAEIFLKSVREAKQSLPHLDEFVGREYDQQHWIDWKYRNYSHDLMTVIDVVRAAWVLSVCTPYIPIAFAEIVWLWYSTYRLCLEIVSSARDTHETIVS